MIGHENRSNSKYRNSKYKEHSTLKAETSPEQRICLCSTRLQHYPDFTEKSTGMSQSANNIMLCAVNVPACPPECSRKRTSGEVFPLENHLRLPLEAAVWLLC